MWRRRRYVTWRCVMSDIGAASASALRDWLEVVLIAGRCLAGDKATLWEHSIRTTPRSHEMTQSDRSRSTEIICDATPQLDQSQRYQQQTLFFISAALLNPEYCEWISTGIGSKKIKFLVVKNGVWREEQRSLHCPHITKGVCAGQHDTSIKWSDNFCVWMKADGQGVAEKEKEAHSSTFTHSVLVSQSDQTLSSGHLHITMDTKIHHSNQNTMWIHIRILHGCLLLVTTGTVFGFWICLSELQNLRNDLNAEIAKRTLVDFGPLDSESKQNLSEKIDDLEESVEDGEKVIRVKRRARRRPAYYKEGVDEPKDMVWLTSYSRIPVSLEIQKRKRVCVCVRVCVCMRVRLCGVYGSKFVCLTIDSMLILRFS